MDLVDDDPMGWASVEPDQAEGAPEGRMVIGLGGEIDAAAVNDMRATINAGLPDPVPPVVFDLSEIEFMDSAGITLLLEFAKRSPKVVVRNPTRAATLVIEATGLGEWLPTE